jgi:hypothetical protein
LPSTIFETLPDAEVPDFEPLDGDAVPVPAAVEGSVLGVAAPFWSGEVMEEASPPDALCDLKDSSRTRPAAVATIARMTRRN